MRGYDQITTQEVLICINKPQLPNLPPALRLCVPNREIVHCEFHRAESERCRVPYGRSWASEPPIINEPSVDRLLE